MLAPDADVLGFGAGIPYEHLLGHRGLSHSVAFAAVVAMLVARFAFAEESWRGERLRIGIFVFIATASHGLLDAMTTGGLGIAFLSPFSNARYFLPWRPIEVSPLSVSSFISGRGLEILASEARWVWLPAAAMAATALILRARRAARPA